MSAFTSSTHFELSKEKDWALALGMLDWDSTNIVFTKRTLLEFLKYTGTTVDTNFANISKMPRYAKIGTIGGDATASATASSEAADQGQESRSVRDPPEGKTHMDIFGGSAGQEGALSSAPPPPDNTQTVGSAGPIKEPVNEPEPEAEYGLDMPSSRSKQNTTQHTSTPSTGTMTTNFWEREADMYKPTRRVRETPGGAGSIQFGS